MKIKVLVIEDKKSLNKNIVNILKFEGYEACGAYDFESSKSTFLAFNPDIIILDIMLPGGKGYDLINFFRNYRDVRVLMLTALDDFDTKKIAYDKGADDYITKPFELEDIIFKVGAIKRRIVSDMMQVQLGDITYNKKQCELACSKRILLAPALSEVFSILINNYLANPSNPNVYEVDAINKRSVQTIINRIRRSLEYVGANNLEIKTLYGKGYILVVHDED